MSIEQQMAIYESMGQFSAYLILMWVAIFYTRQILKLRKCKKLGDTDRARKIKWRMVWGFPLGVVVIFVVMMIVSEIIIHSM